MRRAAAAVMAALVAVALAGCATACPAIGWMNAVTVDTGAIEGVAEVQFCVESECSPREGETPPPGEPLSLLSVTRDGADWILHLDMTAPESIVVRLFTADGILIQQTEETLDWTHSAEPCGGPSTTPPIVL